MNTKLLMMSSAGVLALAGITFSFLPEELLNYAGISPSKPIQLILQIVGALCLGFAILNWMAKSSPMGGIYGRPVAIGNFMHFLIGGLALIKYFFSNMDMKIIMIPAVIYSVFSLLFGLVIFGKPPQK